MTQSLAHPHRVFDPLLRLLHWVIALSIVALIATSQLAATRTAMFSIVL